VASFTTGTSGKSGDDITKDIENIGTEQVPEFEVPSTPAGDSLTVTLPAQN
jgi:hypothetical protein